MTKRHVKESPIERGVLETYPYTFTLTGFVPTGTYANATNALYENDGAGNWTTAVSGWNSGSPSVTSTTFTTSVFVADILTADTRYLLYMSMTIDGYVWDWELWIDAE